MGGRISATGWGVVAAHNDDVELYRTPSLSTGAIDASIVMASSDSLLGVVVELALADEPCWSRSRERPFNSRTRTPTRRNPIESRSAGTRWRRCSTVERPRSAKWGIRLERLSAARKSAADVTWGTRPRSRSPYFALLPDMGARTR